MERELKFCSYTATKISLNIPEIITSAKVRAPQTEWLTSNSEKKKKKVNIFMENI